MNALLSVLRVVLPFLYAAIVLGFGEIFFRAGEPKGRVRRTIPLVILTILLHGLYIGIYTVTYGHCLLTSLFELCSLLAFTLLTVYAFVEIRITKEASGTGFFVAVVSFFFQFVSSLFIDPFESKQSLAIIHSGVFNIHVTSAVFGYAALTLTSIYGSLYLLLYRAMKNNQFGPIFEHLPSLERLERYGFRATGVGFAFLTISIALGASLVHTTGASSGAMSFLDPKILFTVLIWLVFGVTLVVRKFIRLEGRKLVLLWMWGFALTIVSMTLVNAFGTTFHSFL